MAGTVSWPLFSDDLDSREERWSGLCRLLLTDLSNVLLMIRLGLWCLQRKNIEISTLLVTHQGTYHQPDSPLLMVTPNTVLRATYQGFHWKPTLSSPFHLALSGRKSLCAVHNEGRGIIFHLSEGERLHKFRIFCSDLSILLHLIIQSYRLSYVCILL